jgi:hypothetical protein
MKTSREGLLLACLDLFPEVVYHNGVLRKELVVNEVEAVKG